MRTRSRSFSNPLNMGVFGGGMERRPVRVIREAGPRRDPVVVAGSRRRPFEARDAPYRAPAPAVSPAARGLLPGLFLVLAVAFGVLALNRWWLFPALDETGVRYIAAAPDLAAGRAPAIPLAAWDAASPTSGLEGEGKLMPLLMAVAVRGGARPHVAGLWVLAGSAALAMLALAWVVGGVAGVGGALAMGLLVLCAPPGPAAATLLGPDLLLTALVALLLGAMTYQPRWSAAHGVLAALAWLAHPAGVGAVAAAVVWPAARGGSRHEKFRGVALATAAPLLLLAAGTRWPLLDPPARGASGAALANGLRGLTEAAGAGLGGGGGLLLGVAVFAGLGALTLVEAGSTPTPPADPHWSDPAAADLLAARFRPAAGLLTLGGLVATAWSPRTVDPWIPCAYLSARAVRRLRGTLAAARARTGVMGAAGRPPPVGGGGRVVVLATAASPQGDGTGCHRRRMGGLARHPVDRQPVPAMGRDLRLEPRARPPPDGKGGALAPR